MSATTMEIVEKITVDNPEAIKRLQETEKANQKFQDKAGDKDGSFEKGSNKVKKGLSEVAQTASSLGIAAGPAGQAIGGLVSVLGAASGPAGIAIVAFGLLVTAISALAASHKKTKEEIDTELQTVNSLYESYDKSINQYRALISMNDSRAKSVKAISDAEYLLLQVKNKQAITDLTVHKQAQEENLKTLNDTKEKLDFIINGTSKEAKAQRQVAIELGTLNKQKERLKKLNDDLIPTQTALIGKTQAYIDIMKDGGFKKLEDDTKNYTEAISEFERTRISSFEAEIKRLEEEKKHRKELADIWIKYHSSAEKAISKDGEFQLSMSNINTSAKSTFDTLLSGWESNKTAAENLNNVLLNIGNQLLSGGFQFLLTILTGGGLAAAKGGSGLFGSLFGLLFADGGVPYKAANGYVARGGSGGSRADDIPVLVSSGEPILSAATYAQNPATVNALLQGQNLDRKIAMMGSGKGLTVYNNFVGNVGEDKFFNRAASRINNSLRREYGRGTAIGARNNGR